MQLEWLTILYVPVIIFTGWYYTVTVIRSRFPQLRNKRICLLIAHPDDEAMFFAPTILALTAPELGNHIKILCLSSGDADGLGSVRKKELVKSGMTLGLQNEDDVFVVENSDFLDSMTATWDKVKIANMLSAAFTQGNSNTSTQSPTASIDVLITFDSTGISSHPNHISLFHGARHFVGTLTRARSGWACPVDLYTLTSISILRKYTSIFDSLFSMMTMAFRPRTVAKDHPGALLFMSGPAEVRCAQRAMTTAHVSQMRWFRWGWIGLSRYMVLNDLILEKVTGS